MEDTRKATTIVGIVIFIAAVIALWTVFYLQGYLIEKNNVIYHAIFENVGLLKMGDDVSVAGVPVGRVQNINLSGKKAQVTFFVDRSLVITKGTVALIEAGDVFGKTYLHLEISVGEPLPPGSELEGLLAPGLTDAMYKGMETIQRTRDVIDRAITLLDNLNQLVSPQGPVPKAMRNFERLTENTAEFSGNLSDYDHRLRRLMSSLDSTLAQIRSAVDTSSVGIRKTMATFENLSSRIDSILVAVEQGRGTAGLLLHDESLYQDLQDTALEARLLIREIRENPGRFIQIKVF